MIGVLGEIECIVRDKAGSGNSTDKEHNGYRDGQDDPERR
tara:strand:- start:1734 stop:1853 length:120 start_codon:yes stop_codon:yes gene_type:complete